MITRTIKHDDLPVFYYGNTGSSKWNEPVKHVLSRLAYDPFSVIQFAEIDVQLDRVRLATALAYHVQKSDYAANVKQHAETTSVYVIGNGLKKVRAKKLPLSVRQEEMKTRFDLKTREGRAGYQKEWQANNRIT